MIMRSKKGNPGGASLAADPIAMGAHRTRERLEREDAADRRRLWLGEYELAAA